MTGRTEIETKIAAISNDAFRSCGMSYEVYAQRFSQRVGRWIASAPDVDKVLIREAAKQHEELLTIEAMSLLAIGQTRR